MFSGIIEISSKIEYHSPSRIGITLKGKDKKGDSISINGVCLTVVKKGKKGAKTILYFDLSPETLDKSTLKYFKKGTPVHVERALKMSSSLGGHIVQGHVDGVGSVSRYIDQGENRTLWFKAPKSISQYLVPKGSVAIDGVSLTVVDIEKDEFSVAFIPFTLEETNMGDLKVGDPVNLEVDVIAKYVSKYLNKE